MDSILLHLIHTYSLSFLSIMWGVHHRCLVGAELALVWLLYEHVALDSVCVYLISTEVDFVLIINMSVNLIWCSVVHILLYLMEIIWLSLG